MKKTIILIILAMLLSSAIAASPQISQPNNPSGDIEQNRQELLKKWGTTDLIQPKQVIQKAEALFSKPLEEQTVKELEAMGYEANRATNFVGFIQEEYAHYYRDNYRYDFVQSKVAPFCDGYTKLKNRLIDFRNQAFFNLGIKYKNAGNNVAAFFYFYDAFRLSSFTEENGEHKGMRYKAEQEMKKLLDINELESFIYWK